MLKKIVSAILCTCILVSSSLCFAANPIRVELDHMPIVFDQEPLIINDRTMVPVRAIFEAMGASVIWDGETKTVTSKLGNLTISMGIDNPVMTINGATRTLDAPPMIAGGRTLVPVRAVSESFDCDVSWDASKRLVSLLSKDFQQRIALSEPFGCVKPLTDGNNKANVAFGLSYFPEYDVKKNTADGTDIEISHTTSRGHISLNVRTDLFTGVEEPMTEMYANSVAEGIVTVLSGCLISSGVTKLGDTEFVEVHYTAPGVMYGISDTESDITIYIGKSNGVVYTLTYAIYGEIAPEIARDFSYMVQTMLIA